MQSGHPTKLLRIHISESDRFHGKPLHEAIIDKCRELKIAGATVFRGLEGYGETAEMHSGHVIHSNRPILVTIVDTAENLARLMTAVEEMIDTGLLAVSDVRVVRVQRTTTMRDDGKIT
jgi:PII-like signaling protein